MADYKNIPVDEETNKGLDLLCQAYEFGKRGKGAMVRKLVKAELKKLEEVKLLPQGKATKGDRSQPKT